jgi:hypothetical protein
MAIKILFCKDLRNKVLFHTTVEAVGFKEVKISSETLILKRNEGIQETEEQKGE